MSNVNNDNPVVAQPLEELDADKARIVELELELKARFRELAKMTQMMEEAETRHRALQTHTVSDTAHETGPTVHQQSEVIRNDALFDPIWYLKRYADVAASRVDPLEHYLLMGSKEGRDPGPAFSTMAYFASAPDARRDGWTALGHYLLIGRPAGLPKANR